MIVQSPGSITPFSLYRFDAQAVSEPQTQPLSTDYPLIQPFHLQELTAFLTKSRHIKESSFAYGNEMSFAEFLINNIAHTTREVFLTGDAAVQLLLPFYASRYGIQVTAMKHEPKELTFHFLPEFRPEIDFSEFGFKLTPRGAIWDVEELRSSLPGLSCLIPLKNFLLTLNDWMEGKRSPEAALELMENFSEQPLDLMLPETYPKENAFIRTLNEDDACTYHLMQAIAHLHAGEETLVLETAQKIALIKKEPSHPILKDLYTLAKNDAWLLPAFIDQLAIQTRLKGENRLTLENFSIELPDSLHTAVKRLSARAYAPDFFNRPLLVNVDTDVLLEASAELSKSSLEWVKKLALTFFMHAMQAKPKRSFDKLFDKLFRQITPLHYPYQELVELENTLAVHLHGQDRKTMCEHLTLLKLQPDHTASYGLKDFSGLLYENAFSSWKAMQQKNNDETKLLLSGVTDPKAWLELISFLFKTDKAYAEQQIRALTKEKLLTLYPHLTPDHEHLDLFIQTMNKEGLLAETAGLLKSANKPFSLPIARAALSFCLKKYQQTPLDKKELLKELSLLFGWHEKLKTTAEADKLCSMLLKDADAPFLEDHIDTICSLLPPEKQSELLLSLASRKEKEFLYPAIRQAFQLLLELDQAKGAVLIKKLFQLQKAHHPDASNAWEAACFLSSADRKMILETHRTELEPLILQLGKIYKSNRHLYFNLKNLFMLWIIPLSAKARLELGEAYIESTYQAKEFEATNHATPFILQALQEEKNHSVKPKESLVPMFAKLMEAVAYHKEEQDKEPLLLSVITVAAELFTPCPTHLLQTCFKALPNSSLGGARILAKHILEALRSHPVNEPQKLAQLTSQLLDSLKNHGLTELYESLIEDYFIFSVRQTYPGSAEDALSYAMKILQEWTRNRPLETCKTQLVHTVELIDQLFALNPNQNELQKRVDDFLKLISQISVSDSTKQEEIFSDALYYCVSILSKTKARLDTLQKKQLFNYLLQLLERALKTPSFSHEALATLFLNFSLHYLQFDAKDMESEFSRCRKLYKQARNKGVFKKELIKCICDLLFLTRKQMTDSIVQDYSNFWGNIKNILTFLKENNLQDISIAVFTIFAQICPLFHSFPEEFERCFPLIRNICFNNLSNVFKYKIQSVPVYLRILEVCIKTNLREIPQIHSSFKENFQSFVDNHLSLIKHAKALGDDEIVQTLTSEGLSLINFLLLLGRPDSGVYLPAIEEMTKLYLEEIFSKRNPVSGELPFVLTMKVISSDEEIKNHVLKVLEPFKKRTASLSRENKLIWESLLSALDSPQTLIATQTCRKSL